MGRELRHFSGSNLLREFGPSEVRNAPIGRISNTSSGSNLLRKFGAVAQLGEHHVRNVGVVGSNPICSTNSEK